MDARRNSVEKLQGLYSVVAGLSLTSGVEAFLRGPTGGIAFSPEQLPVFVAFLLTLIPFYQGALRHLDHTYLEDPATTPGGAALLADFVLLFTEGCLLVALSRLIALPITFAKLAAVLLLFDSIWALATHAFFRRSRPKHVSAPIRWALINLGFGPVLAALAWGFGHEWTAPALPLTVLLVCLARTIIDYRVSWRFYFP